MMSILGFASLKDFLLSTLGVHSKTTFMMNLLATFFLSIGTFISEWIWPDQRAVIIFTAILVLDWVLGMVRGFKSDDGFKTNKALRIFPKLAVYAIVLSVIRDTFGFTLANIVYSGIIGITLISAIKNAAAIGWITGEAARFLLNHVDRYKNKQVKDAKEVIVEKFEGDRINTEENTNPEGET